MVEFLTKSQKNKGVFLVEVLMVVAIIAILAMFFLFANKTNLNKSLDAKRKTDLYTIAKALEEYEKDNEAYPSALPACEVTTAGTPLEGYIAEVPCDPQTKTTYGYEAGPNQSWFKIFAKLVVTGDPDIAKVGCTAGCGPGGSYNYFTGSPNIP